MKTRLGFRGEPVGDVTTRCPFVRTEGRVVCTAILNQRRAGHAHHREVIQFRAKKNSVQKEQHREGDLYPKVVLDTRVCQRHDRFV